MDLTSAPMIALWFFCLYLTSQLYSANCKADKLILQVHLLRKQVYYLQFDMWEIKGKQNGEDPPEYREYDV